MSAATMTHFINLHAPSEMNTDVGRLVRLVYASDRLSAALVEFTDGSRKWVHGDCLTSLEEAEA